MCTCGDEEDLCCFLGNVDDATGLASDKQNDCLSDEQLLVENTESSSITVTPSTLTFPYNNPNNHTQRLTLWNRTINALKIRIKSPDPDVFTVFLDGKGTRARSGLINQIMLYGLAAKTISIKCTPGRYKIARIPLQLFVHTCRDNTCECVQVPLEIYPSTAWFNLPSTIIIPEVIIGRKAHALIILPQPRVSERFFVTFHPTHTQNSVTLSPMHGTIGGYEGIKQLRVTYAPTEYTTMACSIKVHFPGMSKTASHEIKILGRCRPGNEADLIRKEITEIESFRPKPTKPKKKHPKLRLKPAPLDSHELDQEFQDDGQERKRSLSLFTPAGVTRFLLSKEDENKYGEVEEHKRKTAVELLALQIDLDHDEKVQIYNSIKARLGLDFEDNFSRSKLKSHQRKDWEEFQNAVGMLLMGKVEGLPGEGERPETILRSDSKYGRKGSHGSAGGSVISDGRGSLKLKTQVRQSASKSEKRMYKNTLTGVPLDLTPKQKFVQLVLKIITRQRADKRIRKIKVLVEEIKKGIRRRSSTKAGTLKSAISGKQTNDAIIKQKSAHSFHKLPASKTAVIRDDRKSVLNQKRKSAEDPKDTTDT